MNIVQIEYQLADNSIAIEDLVGSGELSSTQAAVFKKMMGLQFIPIDSASTVFSLLKGTLERIFYNKNINKSNIKYFLFSHTGEFITPFALNYLKIIADQYGLANLKYFATSAYKCAGLFQLIALAKELFEGMNQDDLILISTCDVTLSKILKVIPGSTVMGDSAVSIILSKSGVSHFFTSSLFHYYGQYAKGIWDNTENLSLFQSNYIFNLKKLILKILENNQLQLSDIKIILPHNVNIISWKQVANSLAISTDKIYLSNIKRTAHCFGADPWINLKDAITENKILKGDYYLLVTVGLGATFSALLFKY